MTTTERDIYLGLARTCRLVARNYLRMAQFDRDRGSHHTVAVRREQARHYFREARRWNIVAKMGA